MKFVRDKLIFAFARSRGDVCSGVFARVAFNADDNVYLYIVLGLRR